MRLGLYFQITSHHQRFIWIYTEDYILYIFKHIFIEMNGRRASTDSTATLSTRCSKTGCALPIAEMDHFAKCGSRHCDKRFHVRCVGFADQGGFARVQNSPVNIICDECLNEYDGLKDRVSRLEEEVHGLKNNGAQPGHFDEVQFTRMVCAVVREMGEFESKKSNLVVLGLSENDGKTDNEKIGEFASKLNIPAQDVVECYRDPPTPNPNKTSPRILKVRFGNHASRAKFLSGLRNVVEKDATGRGREWVRPDLTFHQREQDRHLRAECDKMNGADRNRNIRGTGNYVIFQKRVVLRSDLPPRSN